MTHCSRIIAVYIFIIKTKDFIEVLALWKVWRMEMVVAYLGGTTQDRLKELRLLAIHPPTHILSLKKVVCIWQRLWILDSAIPGPPIQSDKWAVHFFVSAPHSHQMLACCREWQCTFTQKNLHFFFIYCSHIFVGCPFLGMCQHCSSLRVICGTPLHAFRAMALRSFWSVQTSSFVPFRKQICAELYLEFFRTASFHFTYFPFFRIKCFQKQDGSI